MGPHVQQHELVDTLVEVGCDDGLVGRSEGVQYIEFDREAHGLDDAVLSAVADIEKVPAATVARIAAAGLVVDGRHRPPHRVHPRGRAPPDCRRTGPWRVPPPVTNPRNRYRLWRWSEVERWLATYRGEPAESPDDDVLTAINASLELRRHGRRVHPSRRTRLRDLAVL